MKTRLLLSLSVSILAMVSMAQVKWEKTFNTTSQHSTSPWELFVDNNTLYVVAEVTHVSNIPSYVAYHPIFNLNRFKILEIDEAGTLLNVSSNTSPEKFSGEFHNVRGIYKIGDYLYTPFSAPSSSNPDQNTFNYGRAVGYVKFDLKNETGTYYIDNQNMISHFLTHGITNSDEFYSFGINTSGFCVFQILDDNLSSATYTTIQKNVLAACYVPSADEFYVITQEPNGDRKLNTLSTSGTLTLVSTLPSTLEIVSGSELFYDGNDFFALEEENGSLKLVKFNTSGTELASKTVNNFQLIKQSPNNDLYLIEYDITTSGNSYTYYQLNTSLNTVYSYTIPTTDIMPLDIQFNDNEGLDIYVLGSGMDAPGFYKTHIVAFDEMPDLAIRKEDGSDLIFKPNPNTSKLVTVQADKAANFSNTKGLKLIVIDAAGQITEVENFQVKSGNQIELVNLNLGTGTYTLNVLSGSNDTLGTGKFVVE